MEINQKNKSKLPPKTSDSISTLRFGFAFFKIGLTAYGMAILQQIKALIIGNRWLTREQVDEGIAMVQFYPGPIMYNLATYCSYRLKGFGGAALATFLFILPSYLLILSLSWLYFSYGEVAWVHPLFLALEAMVIGVVAHVFLDFAGRYASDKKGALLAGVAFLLLLFKIHALYVILIAFVLSILLFFKSKETNADHPTTLKTDIIPGKLSHRLLAIFVVGSVFLAILLVGIFDHSLYAQLLFSMFKVGAVAFGSGFTIMPLLQQEAVLSHHWLTMKQFADGIAFGQITPGPFLITATFIGYKVAGLWGSVLATVGMFFPSFFYTIVITEIYNRIKNSRWIQLAIRGIMSAFTGMIFFVTLSLGRVSLVSPATYVWAVGAFLLVRYYKINLLWIFLIGIAAALGLYFCGFSLG
ncbi:MAG: chromate efflux transporter [Calditrichaeota bacterium]|nr:chromate efflux transporter [Calditrichota bacterium]